MKIQLPPHIDLSHPERYILTIAIEKDKIGFSLYSPIENGSFFYYPPVRQGLDLLSSFQEMLFDNEFLTFPFRKVYALNRTSNYTYVPTIIYKEEDAATYMNFLFDESNEKLLHHSLSFYDFTTLHTIDRELYGFLQRSYVGLIFIHHSAPVLSYTKTRLRTVNANRMMVNITEEGIDLLCFSRDSFLLGNYFSCKEEPDAVYYILYVWKQLGFDQTKDFFYITGYPERRKEIVEVIKNYIHHIIPLTITPEAHFEQIDVGAIPFELSSLTLCEL